ncbi:MAG: hypothetical protein ACYTEV_11975, partial [Planctomycetota bacterium]
MASLESHAAAVAAEGGEPLRVVSARVRLIGRTPLAGVMRAEAARIAEDLQFQSAGVQVLVDRVVTDLRPAIDLAEQSRASTPPGRLAQLLLELDAGTPTEGIDRLPRGPRSRDGGRPLRRGGSPHRSHAGRVHARGPHGGTRMSDGSVAFTELRVDRAPGVGPGDGFALADLSPGVNLIHGPNGSGKTVTGRTVMALLWPAASHFQRVTASGVWTLDGTRWTVDLDAGDPSWRCDGRPSDPPALPPAEARDHHWLGLRELLLEDGPDAEATASMARRIGLEMLGGYDIDAAARAIGADAAPSRPEKRRGELAAATVQLRDARGRAAETAEEAGRIEALREQADRALAAHATCQRLERLIERRIAIEEAAARAAELAAMDSRLERLRGDERTRLDALRADRTRLEAELAAARDRQHQAHARLEAAGLPEDGLPEGVLASLDARATAVAELERSHRERQQALAEAEAAEATHRRVLGPKLDETALEAAGAVVPEDFARHAQDLAAFRAKRAGHEAARARWTQETEANPATATTADPADDPARLQRAGDALADWLATPASAPSPASGWSGMLLAAAGVIVALATALAVLAHPAWALAAVVAAVFLVRARPTRPDAAAAAEGNAREHARRSFERLELPTPPAPEAWTPEAVGHALQAVQSQQAAHAAARTRAERLAEQKHALDAEEAALAADGERLAAAGAAIAAGIGLEIDPDRADWLAVLGRAVADWHAARARRVAAADAIAAIRTQFETRAAEFAAAATTLVAVEAASLDAAAARGLVADLRTRAAAWTEARQAGEAADREVARATAELDRLDAAEARMLEDLGIDPGREHELDHLLAAREDHEQRRRAGDAAAARVAAAEDALRTAADSGATVDLDEESREADLATLQARLVEARALAAEGESLIAERSAIETRVAQDRDGRSIEQAIAAVAEHEQSLLDARDGAESAVVGHAVASWLREQSARHGRPAMLQGASEHFQRITSGRYTLELEAGSADAAAGTPSFLARDQRDGHLKPVGHLSAGERVQLLLAVRLGFLEQDERGLTLPIVLDEILGNADDERAAAIIDAVLGIARAGRQVFYLSAQPDEVGKWRARLAAESDIDHRVIDLAATRGRARASASPLPVDRPARPSVPAPIDGEDHAAYGRRLGVPGLRPEAGAGRVHPWHVLESPQLLHAALMRGLADL